MTMSDESYFGGLYATISDKDQRHMSAPFREFFNQEADAGGFTRGEKSFFVVGPSSTDDCRYAFACLIRGGFNAVYAEPRTILRRLDNKWIPRWIDEDDKRLETAETLIIPDPFDPELLQSIANTHHGDIAWFIRDAIHNGSVVVIPTINTDIDLNAFGESFGSFVEKNFEVFEYGAASKDKREQVSDKSKHGRDATTGCDSKQRFRKKHKGRKP